MRVLASGDIHGRIEALKQCLERSRFRYRTDKLIILGDYSDGGYNTYEVVEELLKIKNKIFVLGNHDEFVLNFISSGWTNKIWINQGGANTLNSYGGDVIPGRTIHHEPIKIDTRGVKIPKKHIEFFNSARFYYEYNKMLFVHGGYDPTVGVNKTDKHTLLWDRSLIDRMRETNHPLAKYKKVFIGHTTTNSITGKSDPAKYNNLYLLDTGAGLRGKLTIMDVNTEQYWQSDKQEP